MKPENCKFAYWEKGMRTYGSAAPDNAQGCYFPCEEPGWNCDQDCSAPDCPLSYDYKGD